jgi:MoaA/NifB/PqqE/SkfB family radical SAM enzyme
MHDSEWVTPTTLCVDPTTHCQLRCPGCPNTGRGNPPPGKLGTPPGMGWGSMKIEDFKTLADAPQGFERVYFSSLGEMLLNRDFLAMIEYARAKGLEISMDSVNFNHVSDAVLEGLVRYGVKHMVCAIDGATPESYRIYRKRGDFDRVIANIRRLNHWKKVYDSLYPELTWQFVVFGHTEHEIGAANKLARELGMRFVGKMNWSTTYSPISDAEAVKEQIGWSAANRDEFKEKHKRHYAEAVCLQLWHNPWITWSGDVMGCCWTQQGFGANAVRDGYLEAVNSEKIRYARRMLMGEAEPRDDIPCTTCRIYLERKKHHAFVTRREVSKPLWYRAARSVYRRSGLRRRVTTLSARVRSLTRPPQADKPSIVVETGTQ